MIASILVVSLAFIFGGWCLGRAYERRVFIKALDIFAKKLTEELDKVSTFAEAEKIVRDFAKKRGLR